MIAKCRCMAPLIFIGLFCCLCPNLGGAQPKEAGTIGGRVVSEKGKPVSQAQVYLGSMGATIGARRYVSTDSKGHFIIDHVPWGRYYVFARKDSAGYPDQGFAFYDNNGVPKTSISPSAPDAVVTVRVGPPCGFLRLISITDAVSGHPVADPVVTLRRASNPRIFQAFGFSSGPILVPSGVEVLVEISASGYESWPDSAETTDAKLRLKPRQLFELNVKLRPSKTRNSK